MADENKTCHFSPATSTAPEPTSDSDGDPYAPPPSATANGEDESEEEEDKDPDDQETAAEWRDSKRRKICPSALEKCESIFIKSCSNNSSNCFSFSFDPKFCSGVSTPEVTPKFGSFNLVAAAGISTEIEEKAVEEKEEEERDDEVKENRKILEVLGSVDGEGAD